MNTKYENVSIRDIKRLAKLAVKKSRAAGTKVLSIAEALTAVARKAGFEDWFHAQRTLKDQAEKRGSAKPSATPSLADGGEESRRRLVACPRYVVSVSGESERQLTLRALGIVLRVSQFDLFSIPASGERRLLDGTSVRWSRSSNASQWSGPNAQGGWPTAESVAACYLRRIGSKKGEISTSVATSGRTVQLAISVSSARLNRETAARLAAADSRPKSFSIGAYQITKEKGGVKVTTSHDFTADDFLSDYDDDLALNRAITDQINLERFVQDEIVAPQVCDDCQADLRGQEYVTLWRGQKMARASCWTCYHDAAIQEYTKTGELTKSLVTDALQFHSVKEKAPDFLSYKEPYRSFFRKHALTLSAVAAQVEVLDAKARDIGNRLWPTLLKPYYDTQTANVHKARGKGFTAELCSGIGRVQLELRLSGKGRGRAKGEEAAVYMLFDESSDTGRCGVNVREGTAEDIERLLNLVSAAKFPDFSPES